MPKPPTSITAEVGPTWATKPVSWAIIPAASMADEIGEIGRRRCAAALHGWRQPLRLH
jgi:hypothetical protein